MEFRLLGPVTASLESELAPAGEDPVDATDVDLGSPQQRAVLVALLLAPGHAVPVSRIVDTVWGEHPPRTAVKNLQGHVHRLRRALAPDVSLRTVGDGYLLEVDPDTVDLHRFRRHVRAARQASSDAQAVDHYDAALRLWHGEPLSGVAGAAARAIADGIADEHLSAQEERIAALLRLGRHNECVGELAALVEAHPLREETRAHLMTALAGCGRQAEALAAYWAGRELLRDELGVDPGSQLREAYESILRGAAEPAEETPRTASPPRPAPSVAIVPAPARGGRRLPRWALIVTAGALVPAALLVHESRAGMPRAHLAAKSAGRPWAPGVVNQHLTDQRAHMPEPMDGDDPRARGCGDDARTVVQAPLRLADGSVFGTLRLRHSATCGTDWGSAYYANPRLFTVHIVAHRPSDGAIVQSQWDNNTPPGSYGDMLSTSAGCVWVEAWVVSPAGTSPRAHTSCATG
ncbi:BTAD domain-containing putative transcriptional regulator [Actinoallomurus acanthiterrae]